MTAAHTPTNLPPDEDAFAAAAAALHRDVRLHHPALREAAALMSKGQPGPASTQLQEFLKAHPSDTHARYLLADIALRQGRNGAAAELLSQCVQLAPDFNAARFSFANALIRLSRGEEALREADALLVQAPRNPLFHQLKALAHETTDDFAASADIWRGLIEEFPTRADCRLRYGHALRATGARDESVAAYRALIALDPGNGGAWWALADMKAVRFSDGDVAEMERALERSEITSGDRARLQFALGKAYADQKLYEKSFHYYSAGNALHRAGIRHDPEVLTAYVARCKTLFTQDFFRARGGAGSAIRDPIFIVGLPRSGSTLVEQILASHSKVEATRELIAVTALSNHIQNTFGPTLRLHYPEILAEIDASQFAPLGERYLERVSAYRRLGRPHFTDKMGPNFVHVGMLHLTLPNAKIVDVRRHPLAAGFSIFAQLFPEGQNDAYSLSDIGRLYRDYADLMAHFDRVLPGCVHRVLYEKLVTEPEAEIRRLLDYLELPYEPACLEFHKTERVVTTASSEQVRSPLYRDSLEQWRHYEPWLGPLKGALGTALDAYADDVSRG
jgi:tetratricopeptide (TPR) repeat protein